jgi:hypothetical protein
MSAERIASRGKPVLADLPDVLREKLSELEGRRSRVKYLLSGLNALAFNLMEWEYWADAELVLSTLVRLSLTNNQAFFLSDARSRQAVCLKLLGRIRELESMRDQIPAGTRFWMQNKFWYVDDL